MNAAPRPRPPGTQAEIAAKIAPIRFYTNTHGRQRTADVVPENDLFDLLRDLYHPQGDCLLFCSQFNDGFPQYAVTATGPDEEFPPGLIFTNDLQPEDWYEAPCTNWM